MSFVPNFPPSILRKVGDQETDDGKKKTKEDFKRMKEIEEARKLAVMPAMKDEEGRDINPHIPQYIMQAPWYFGSLKPTLKHQRMQDEEKRDALEGAARGSSAFNKWYKRGVQLNAPRAKKFREGACENCGALTHDRKNCLERPRKVGAKYTGMDIAPDEFEQEDIKLGYDAKRDRWNGYDAREHQRFVAEFQRLEEARKIVKAKKIEEKLAKATSKSEEQGPGSSKPNLDDEEGDDDRYGDELDMPGQKFDSKQRQSIRNLRIREDTAKYLYNLDPNSAYYDPKTRAMRENPFENSGKSESEVPFAGDNFIRNDGDAPAMLKRQVFAWEMQNKLGLDLHLQADPTRLELLAKKVSMAKEEAHSAIREEILEKYGGREHLEAPSRDLLLGQWESYAEYTPTGRVLKGSEKATVRSRYEEDVYPKNHKSVWGSYWYAGQWGYRCCHSLIKESYCMGEKGKANAAPPNTTTPTPSTTATTPGACGGAVPNLPEVPPDAQIGSSVLEPLLSISHSTEDHVDAKSKYSEVRSESDEDEAKAGEKARIRREEFERSKERRKRRAKKRKEKKNKSKSRHGKKHKRSRSHSRSRSSSRSSSSESSSNGSELEDEETKREKKVQEEMEKERKRLAEVERLMAMDERSRPYHSLSVNDGHVPTQEEMEAYYRLRQDPNDPMTHF
nr:step II splicing factor slu7 [Hymenolepis microstoma]